MTKNNKLPYFKIIIRIVQDSQWSSNFQEDDTLLCALDRIFDDASVFNIKGESFRGKKLETFAIQTNRVVIPDSSEIPPNKD